MFRLLFLLSELLIDVAKTLAGLPPTYCGAWSTFEPHAAFLTESRHVDLDERHEAGNPGRPSFSAQVRFGEPGAPSVPMGSVRAWLRLVRGARKFSQLRRNRTQALFQHLQSIAKFLIGDIQRHQQPDDVVIRPRRQHQHALLQAMLHQLFRGRRASSTMGIDKLHRLHRANPANIRNKTHAAVASAAALR